MQNITKSISSLLNLSQAMIIYKVINGVLTHSTYDNLKKTEGDYNVGPAAPNMREGKKYTSFDGVHFAEVGTKNVITYYPYFQFQSVRQPSTYSAAELDSYIDWALRDRESTGHCPLQRCIGQLEADRFR